MSRKFQWYKMDADAYLADSRILDLTWTERGVLQAVWCWLWTQTDEPGRAVLHGVPCSFAVLLRSIDAYSRRGKGPKGTSKALERLINSGLIKQELDGTYYSSRIIKDIEYIEAGRIGGLARKRKSVTGSVTGLPQIGNPESELEKEKDPERGRARDTSDSRGPLTGPDLIRHLADKLTMHRFKKGDR